MAEEKSFGRRAFEKVIENLISVKVWIIFSVIVASSVFLGFGLLSGSVWASVNGGVISTVIALREVFKVAKIKTPDSVIGNEKDMVI